MAYAVMATCALAACVTLAGRSDAYTDPLSIYVISLKRRPERLEATLAHLRAPVTVVDAVDGHSLDISALKTTLTTGEVGCFLSHLKALSQVAADLETGSADLETGSTDWALVLEDDARLRVSLDTIRDLLREISADVDIVCLGANYLPPPAQMRRLSPRLVEFVNYSLCGAHAMLVSRRGARKVLDAPKDFKVAYDVWVAQTVRVAVAVPSMAVPANIQDSETQKTR